MTAIKYLSFTPDNLADFPAFQRIVRRHQPFRAVPFAAEQVADVLAARRFTLDAVAVRALAFAAGAKGFAVEVAERRADADAGFAHLQRRAKPVGQRQAGPRPGDRIPPGRGAGGVSGWK